MVESTHMSNLDEKERELKEQFNKEQDEAVAIEEQIRTLQVRYKEKVTNMTKLQGAFSLLKELKEGV